MISTYDEYDEIDTEFEQAALRAEEEFARRRNSRLANGVSSAACGAGPVEQIPSSDKPDLGEPTASQCSADLGQPAPFDFVLAFSGCSQAGVGGMAGAGAALYDGAARVASESWWWLGPDAHSKQTAEYAGLLVGLRRAAGTAGCKRVKAIGTSNLVVNQMNGKWQAEADFKVYREAALNVTRGLDVLYVHTADKDAGADTLAARAVELQSTGDAYYNGYHAVDRPPAPVVFATPSPPASAPSATGLGGLFVMNFDGGSRGNPGPSGGGAVIVDSLSGRAVFEGWEYVGPATNNEAEYAGLLVGLKAAKALGIARLQVIGDSKLVINQMKGSWKVNKPHLNALRKKACDIAVSIKKVEYSHVLRQHNGAADALANRAMDLAASGEIFHSLGHSPAGNPVDSTQRRQLGNANDGEESASAKRQRMS